MVSLKEYLLAQAELKNLNEQLSKIETNKNQAHLPFHILVEKIKNLVLGIENLEKEISRMVRLAEQEDDCDCDDCDCDDCDCDDCNDDDYEDEKTEEENMQDTLMNFINTHSDGIFGIGCTTTEEAEVLIEMMRQLKQSDYPVL